MGKTKGAGFDQSVEAHLPKGKKILFGIGINAYQSKFWPPLNNAVSDVEAMADTLRNRYDFDKVRLLINEEATAANIQDALYRFTDPSEIGEHDSLLVYYSGHGHLDKNELGYWVPVDAEKDKIYTYLPNSRIRELIANIKCRHVLFISDACFSGSIFVKGVRGSGEEEVAEEYEKRNSRWAFCSGRHDEMVSDGKPGGHSPFASAIIEELNLNERKKLNFARLADKVIEITRSNYKQMPEANPIQDAGHKGGQFVFTLKDPDWKMKLPERISVPKPPVPDKLWTRILLASVVAVGIAIATWAILSKKTEEACLSLINPPTSLGTVEIDKPQTIQFRLKNCGEVEARLKPFQFSSNTDITMAANQISKIAAGKEQSFSAEWKPKATGPQKIQITVGAENLKEEMVVEVEAMVVTKDTSKSLINTGILAPPQGNPLTPAKIKAMQTRINIGDIEVGKSKDFNYTLQNLGNSPSSRLEMSMEYDDGSSMGGELEGINGKGSRTYSDTWNADEKTGVSRCTLTVKGHPGATIVFTARIIPKAIIGDLREVSAPDIPMDVKMWLITAGGRRIDAMDVNGVLVFKIPFIVYGGPVKVYFKRNGKEDWISLRIGKDRITLPDGM